MSVKEVDSNVQGTIATEEKTTYGTPPVSMGTKRVNTPVTIPTVAAGWMIAHRPPRTDC